MALHLIFFKEFSRYYIGRLYFICMLISMHVVFLVNYSYFVVCFYVSALFYRISWFLFWEKIQICDKDICPKKLYSKIKTLCVKNLSSQYFFKSLKEFYLKKKKTVLPSSDNNDSVAKYNCNLLISAIYWAFDVIKCVYEIE